MYAQNYTAETDRNAPIPYLSPSLYTIYSAIHISHDSIYDRQSIKTSVSKQISISDVDIA